MASTVGGPSEHPADRTTSPSCRHSQRVTRLVMASANPHKATEIATVLREVMPDVQILPRPPELGDVVEDGATLEENALIKARFVFAATNESAIADDTGLEVDALGGAPGVYSARYAGPEEDPVANVAKLVDVLVRVPIAQRRARFRTVVAVVLSDRRELLADGVVEGTIALAPRGKGGFGYDSVFIPDGPAHNEPALNEPAHNEPVSDKAAQLTFAEMSVDEKNQISHRARALRALAAQL